MKKTILILLMLLVCNPYEPPPAEALSPAIQAVLGAGGVAACGDVTTARTDGTTNVPVSEGTNNELYMASSFQATATGSIKTVYIYIRDAGTPSSISAYLNMYLCAGNGTNPNAIGTCTASSSNGSVTDPAGTVVQQKYSFAGFNVTSGTEYWIILTSSTGSNNASHYFFVQANSVVTGDHIFDSPDGSTWNTWDTSAQFNFIATSCDE